MAQNKKRNRYLGVEKNRSDAILGEGEYGPSDRFAFQHQDISEEERYRKDGVGENFLQTNKEAGRVIRRLSPLIEDAADEFGVSPDLVKAAIYTEAARGGLYGHVGDALRVSGTGPAWKH